MAGTVGRSLVRALLNVHICKQPRLHAAGSKLGHRFESTYKAAVLQEFKKDLVIKEQKRTKLREDEVRIKVNCCSVNASDIMICQGLHEISPKLPFIPGYEVSGEILELGSKVAKELKVGSKIVGLNQDLFSGFAEECVLSSKDAWQLPSDVSFQTAVALAESYSTALIGLVRRGKLKKSDTVLIMAASGALGLAAVDIAANVYRAKVIAVCDTEEKTALLREKGAWAALTNVPKEILKRCAKVTGGEGVRMVFEPVESDMLNSVLKCVAAEGVAVIAGTASGPAPVIKYSELLPMSVSLMCVSLRNYRRSNPEVYRQIIQDAIDMADQRLVNPAIGQKFSLEKVNEAVQFVLDKKSTEKVIITMKKE